MADGEQVDLDDLIEKDKKAHRLQRKTQIIHKPPRNNHRPRNTDNRRDNFHRRNDWQHKEDINDRDRGEKG